MKVLFLDIDGVLNRKGTMERCGHFLGVDRQLSGKLLDWLKDRDVSIVLSSTWRLHPEMWDHLNEAGIRWVDITPDIGARRQEIRYWLNQHPEVTKWAAIDDMVLSALDEHWVKTDTDTGITDDHLTRLSELLDD